MNKTKYTLTLLAAVMFIVTCATAGQASAQRTFVAGPGIGNDSNTASDCSFSTPCRNFAAAYTVTNVGGEIITLSAGAGYGALTITHAITVTGLPGQVAFVAVAAGTTGFSVAAGASDLVVIRDIHFNGQNSGTNTGLSATGGKLIVKHCVFESLATGVSVVGTGGSNAKMDLIDSDFYNNTTAVSCDGAGASSPGNGTTVSVALIRINGGNIIGNGTGLLSKNPGTTGANSTFLSNIWIFSLTSSPPTLSTNLIGNTTPTLCVNATNCIFSNFRFSDTTAQ